MGKKEQVPALRDLYAGFFVGGGRRLAGVVLPMYRSTNSVCVCVCSVYCGGVQLRSLLVSVEESRL